VSGGGGVVNQLTEVLREHRLRPGGLADFCSAPGCPWEGYPEGFTEHVAAAIQESLNLTEETCKRSPSRVDASGRNEWHFEHRFVTPWLPSRSGDTA